MKKRFLTIMSATLCVWILSVTAFAYQSNVFYLTSENINIPNEITNALNNSNALKGYLSPKESANIENNENQNYNIRKNASLMASTDVILPIYSVMLDTDHTSINDFIMDKNDMWIAVNDSGYDIGFSYLKIGEKASAVANRVNSLNISNEYKDKLIKRAREREDKWYVACVEKQNSILNARAFTNRRLVEDFLAENNIQDIEDIKYIYLQNNNTLAISIKTINSEYIIPYDTSSTAYSLSSENIYSIDEFKSNILG